MVTTQPTRSWSLRLFLPFVVLLAAPGLPAAHAGFQTATFTLDLSNVFGSGNYGTVKIDANTTTGTVTFTVDSPASDYTSVNPKAFGIDKFALNFNPSLNITAAQVSVNASGWSAKIDPPNSVSEFGKFDLEVAGSGAKDRVDPLIVTISGLGANAILSNFEFLSTNGHPDAYFAAHVAGFSLGNESSHYIAVTDLTPVSPTPAPSGIALALLGIGGLGLHRWRRRGQAV